jgi:hypothetical protein
LSTGIQAARKHDYNESEGCETTESNAKKRVKKELGVTAAMKPFRWWTNLERRFKREVGGRAAGIDRGKECVMVEGRH